MPGELLGNLAPKHEELHKVQRLSQVSNASLKIWLHLLPGILVLAFVFVLIVVLSVVEAGGGAYAMLCSRTYATNQ